MGEARNIMNRMTAAMIAGDMEALGAMYAADAVIESPDLGEVKGREQIVEYLQGFVTAFPDARFEMVAQHETAHAAIDEGYFTGTNTGPLPQPSGGELPPTGRTMRLRTADIATVENGLITRHHFYYDQLDFATQLGLLPPDVV